MKQTVPPWKMEVKKRPLLHSDQCTYCKETGHWENECSHCTRMCEWSKKSNQLNKGRYQPELYWTGKSRIRLGRTGLPDPGLLAAYGGNEVRGPINNFYGGHQS